MRSQDTISVVSSVPVRGGLTAGQRPRWIAHFRSHAPALWCDIAVWRPTRRSGVRQTWCRNTCAKGGKDKDEAVCSGH